jgi:iron complex transport system substrate-binding protein
LDKRLTISLALVSMLIIGGIATALVMEEDEHSNGVLTDAIGNEVSTGDIPETIISTNPSTTETLFAFGLGERVIGVSSYCDFPQEVLDRVEATKAGTAEGGEELEIVGSFTNPNQEKIVSMDPDLVVVTGGMASHISVAEKLNAMGIHSIVLYEGKSFEEIFANVRIIGTVMGMDDVAETIIGDMNARMEALANALEGAERPDVLVSLSIGDAPWVCGNGSFLDQIITDGGGHNIFSDSVTSGLGEWFQVNKEVVLDRDPDVIIITAEHLAPGTNAEDFYAAIASDTIWGNTNAVKNGRVFLMYGQANNVFCRQSPRVVDASYLMAEIVHPEIFDVDLPMGIGDDYTEYLVQLGA